MFEHFGLEYMKAVCAAIEKYTKKTIKNDPKAFNHHGMNLQYAIERSLFIDCVNSKPLYQKYIFHVRNIKLPNMQNINRRSLDIWRLMYNPTGVNNFYVDIVRNTIESWVRRLLEINKINTKQIKSDFRNKSIGTVFYVNNIKFARYLRPIAAELDNNSYVYLSLCHNQKLAKELSQEGYPIVNYLVVSKISRRIFCSKALSLFMPILREADNLYQALNTIRPKSVIVVEGNAPSDAITSEVCRILGIPCYCVQQGWSPYIHNGFRNMQYTEMFVWGERFAKLLEPYNPDQKFLITGSHAVSRKPFNELTRLEEIKVISFFLQAPSPLISESSFYEFLDLIVDVATEHPNIKVLVRPHPNYPLTTQCIKRLSLIPSLCISLPAKETIQMVLEKSDLVVSIFSTVLLEALAMKVVPIICSIGAISKYEPDLASLGVALEAHSSREAKNFINSVIANCDLISDIQKKINSYSWQFFSELDSAKIIADRIRKSECYSNGGLTSNVEKVYQ